MHLPSPTRRPAPPGVPSRAAQTVAVALLAVAGLAVAPAAPAGAHATLIGTAPAADEVVDRVPGEVELRFDEPVETVEGALQVFGPDGDRVDDGGVALADGGAVVRGALRGDARGTYTVAWRVTSEDGHPLSGSLVFHVGTRTGAVALDDGDSAVTDVVGGVGRWLAFAGTLVAAGAAALAVLAAPRGAPRRRRATTAGDDRSAVLAATGSESRAHRRLGWLAGASAGAAVAGVLVALVATLADGSGRSLWSAAGLIADLAGDTRTGRLALTRAALLGVAAAGALVAPVWRRSPVPAGLAAGASLVVTSLAGHAWTAPARAATVVSDAVHLGAVALWIGGVVALVAVLPVVADRPRLARRFSALALGTAVVVAASGTVSGWQQVRTLDGLTSTTYGQLLLVKVAGFGGLVALGWLNRARLVPLVERTLVPLGRSLRAEVAVAAVVLAVTAGLVHRAPPRSTESGPFEATVEAGGGTLEAVVDPARAGANDVHLFFTAGADGEPLAVDAVQVTAATAGVPARRLDVTPVTPNHVTIAGASLPSPGTWTLEVTAVREGAPLTFTLEVPIR
jgi:copper transport protein